MGTRRIPVRGDLDAYTMTVQLDGGYYTLSLRWNGRAQHWFMDVLKSGVEVLRGALVVCSQDLLPYLAYQKAPALLPPGTFRVLDVAGMDRDPDRATFGDELLLLYDEVAA